jgi:transcriptional regulator with XRE-family HTH domain
VRSSGYTFGRRLKEQRERHGITLQTIAGNTKINVSLLAGLERGDLSAWPNGIFRRAFVREYATAIGVAPEPIVAEFTRLFPDQGTVEAAVVPQPTSELRMTLAIDERGVTTDAVTRVTIALLEVCLIVVVSVATAWVQGADVWRICAAVALIYYPLATALAGRSRAVSYIQSRFHTLGKIAHQVTATDAREALHLVTRPSPEAPRESAEDFATAASPLRSASRLSHRRSKTRHS